MSNFYIKRNDTKPDLVAILQRADGTYPSLGSATVMFKMRKKSETTLKVNQPATKNDELHTVKYEWQPVDTDETGIFLAEFEVTQTTGAKETYPNDGYFVVEISSDL